MKSRFFVAVFLMVSMAIWNVPLLCAQEDEPEGFMLEEITVTAQKRAENQQKVAIAMDVITAESLKTTGKRNIDDILSNVSNVLVQKTADGMRVSLRGYSDSTPPGHGQSTSTPAVAVNVDGVYSNRKDSGYAMYDMERVEVLFGPQSTLYASNSPGGIVNIETASPKLDKYEASGTLEYGSYELLHSEGMVNVPVNDIMAMRAAFQTQNHDGYYSNGGDDEDTKSGRLKFLVQPTEDFNVSVTGEVIKTVTHRSGSYVEGGYEDINDLDDPWDTDRELGDPDVNTSKKLNAKMNWDLGFGSLSATANYAKHNGSRYESMWDQGVGAYVNWDMATYGEEKGAEIRLASSPDSFFAWIVGANYYEAEDWLDGLAYNATTGELIVYPGEEVNTGVETPLYRFTGGVEEAKAAFANVTYPVTDSFRAKVGLRYSKDDYVYHNNELRGAPGGGMEDTAPKVIGTPYDDLDYMVGFEYDLNEDSMLYATYATSYKVQGLGGGRPGHPGNETLPPEELDAFTLGAKNRFFDNSLQVNVSAFYYLYENFNAGDFANAYLGELNEDGSVNEENFDPMAFDADPGGSSFGDGTWYGLDMQTTAILSANDTVNLSLSYLHSEWTELIFDYEYEWLSTAAFGPGVEVTIDDLAPAETKSLNGKPMTQSPEWTINLGYTHKFVLPNGGAIDARLDAKYKSDYELSWKEKDYPNNYQEAFVNGDVTLTYSSPDGQWNLSGYCKNVRDYAEKRTYMGDPEPQTRLGSPRVLGAVFSARF